jgi:hypothetical protein
MNAHGSTEAPTTKGGRSTSDVDRETPPRPPYVSSLAWLSRVGDQQVSISLDHDPVACGETAEDEGNPCRVFDLPLDAVVEAKLIRGTSPTI